MLCPIINFIMDDYLCVDYLCLQQAQLHLAHKCFDNTSLNDISGIVIPSVLFNILSCYVFVNNQKSTIILSCHRKLVFCYVSKVFSIIDNNSSDFKYVYIRVKDESMKKTYIKVIFQLCSTEKPFC